jgi:lysophospholipase L1-like esterase
MIPHSSRPRFPVVPMLLTLTLASDASASTIAQNVAWTIDRPESEAKYRVVVYGDSIFAGYKGSISRVAVMAAPTVDGEYASNLWGADVETIRRTKSGAKAGDVYENKVVDDASWMQDPATRVVAFEMCGNDALQARNNLSQQNGVCDYRVFEEALADCSLYQEQSMVFINANAAPGTLRKVVANLYYPGYDHDVAPTNCVDPVTGQSPRRQDVFLPYLLRMNWSICDLARRNGFDCADTFAGYMGSDYDTNGDRKKDSRALRYRRGESEAAYVTRLGTTLRATIRDPEVHFASATNSFDYIQSDDTHPTYKGGTVYLGFLGGSGSGSSEPRYAPDRYRRRHNPIWKRFGHERLGQAMALSLPAAP